MSYLEKVGVDDDGNIIYRASFVPPHKDSYGSPTIKFLTGSGVIGYQIDDQIRQLPVKAGDVVPPSLIDYQKVSHWFVADPGTECTFVRLMAKGTEPEVEFRDQV